MRKEKTYRVSSGCNTSDIYVSGRVDKSNAIYFRRDLLNALNSSNNDFSARVNLVDFSGDTSFVAQMVLVKSEYGGDLELQGDYESILPIYLSNLDSFFGLPSKKNIIHVKKDIWRGHEKGVAPRRSQLIQMTNVGSWRGSIPPGKSLQQN